MHLPSLITPPQRQELQRQLAGTGQARMLRELAQALEMVTTDMPLVLWLQDLHWSDQATLVLLTALARRPESARLMIVGTYRPADIRVRASSAGRCTRNSNCTDTALRSLCNHSAPRRWPTISPDNLPSSVRRIVPPTPCAPHSSTHGRESAVHGQRAGSPGHPGRAGPARGIMGTGGDDRERVRRHAHHDPAISGAAA